mmetsp:Transcript_23312/g.71410  ORF Transcript_23312/g.71410 Transcript_23312/m.71410 type:complete len:254 (-) Transcript_23312:95-856(-)
MFGLGLTLDERGCNRGTGLQYNKLIIGGLISRTRPNLAFVLMTPNHNVHTRRQLGLLYVALLINACAALDPVLMYSQKIKPLVCVHRWSRDSHLLPLEHAVQPLITNMPQPVEGEFGLPLFNQDGMKCHSRDVVGATEVVDEIGRGHNIQRGQSTITRRIVVVAMDREDGELDIHVGILKVDLPVLVVKGGVAIGDHIESHCSLAKDVIAEQLHALLYGTPRRLVVVEQVAGKEDEIDLELVGLDEQLLERVE